MVNQNNVKTSHKKDVSYTISEREDGVIYDSRY